MPESLDFSVALKSAESVVVNAFSGDPVSVIMIAGISILLIALLFEVSSILFAVVKRTFLFIIIGLSVYFFLSTYGVKLAQEGFTGQLIVAGVIGIAVAASALVIAFGSLARHAKSVKWQRPKPEPEPKKAPVPGVGQKKVEQLQVLSSDVFSKDYLLNSLKDDKSLLAVLSYVIVAQFGVFSSITVSAPNPQAGLVFLVIFLVGAFVFIKTTYHDYAKGVRHFIVASFFGVPLSIVLGLFWAEFPVETMLSFSYFETPALVAFVTSIGISLLMSSRN